MDCCNEYSTPLFAPCHTRDTIDWLMHPYETKMGYTVVAVQSCLILLFSCVHLTSNKKNQPHWTDTTSHTWNIALSLTNTHSLISVISLHSVMSLRDSKRMTSNRRFTALSLNDTVTKIRNGGINTMQESSRYILMTNGWWMDRFSGQNVDLSQ